MLPKCSTRLASPDSSRPMPSRKARKLLVFPAVFLVAKEEREKERERQRGRACSLLPPWTTDTSSHVINDLFSATECLLLITPVATSNHIPAPPTTAAFTCLTGCLCG